MKSDLSSKPQEFRVVSVARLKEIHLNSKMKISLFLLLTATALFYYPFAFEEFETAKSFALLTFACFAMFFVPWKQVFKDRIAQALILICFSAGVSAIFSIDWHMSLFGNSKCPMGFLVIFSYFITYSAALEVFRSEENKRHAVDIVLACAGIVAIYAFFQAFGHDFNQWSGLVHEDQGGKEVYTRPMSTLGHPNFMANYLAMILPFALWRMEGHLCGRRKVVYPAILLVVFSVAAIFVSLSRGMYIAAAVGVITYFFFNKKSYKQAIWFLAVTGIIVGIGFASIPMFKKNAVRRIDALLSPGPARVEYPKGAIRIWKRYPWLGIGTDAFELGFQSQRTPYYWQIERGGSPHRAHNDFLNILATQGIFGALAAFLLTVAVIFRALKSRSAMAAPTIAGILVYYVAGLTSFTVIATGVLFMVYLAFLKEETT